MLLFTTIILYIGRHWGSWCAGPQRKNWTRCKLHITSLNVYITFKTFTCTSWNVISTVQGFPGVEGIRGIDGDPGRPVCSCHENQDYLKHIIIGDFILQSIDAIILSLYY